MAGYEEGSASGEEALEGSAEEAGEGEGVAFDLPEYSEDVEDNLVEEEEPIEEDSVEEGSADDEAAEAEERDLENAGSTYEAPAAEIPEGDPANLPNTPPGSKVECLKKFNIFYILFDPDPHITPRTWPSAPEEL